MEPDYMATTLLATCKIIPFHPHNNFRNVLLFSFRGEKTRSKSLY